jgi:hypothetical protein
MTRLRLAYALLGIMLAWPPLHMVLARQLRFSSWRFGGWGMYATPDPRAVVDFVFLSDHGGPATSTLRRPLGVGRLERGEVLPIDYLPPLPASLVRPALQRAQVLRDLDSMRFLAQVAHLGPELDGALILRLERRYHPISALAFEDIDAYALRADTITNAGELATDSVDATALRAFLSAGARAANLEALRAATD